MKRKISISLFFILFLAACNAVASATPQTEEATPTIVPTQETATVTPSSFECQAAFERRELTEPYQRQTANQPRYTLSTDELNSYLDLMGIQSLCIPAELGAPFLSVDWNSVQNPATTGRMISISFENLYPGAGWSDGFLLYSTYEFSTGSEYDKFASLKDRDAVRNHTAASMIEINGVEGFIRFWPGLSYGNIPIYKTYVLPFENHYIAVIYKLGVFDPAEVDSAIQEFQAGRYPTDRLAPLEMMDFLATSLRFK